MCSSRSIRGLAALLVAASAIACADSTAPNPADEPRFDVQVSGAATRSFTGPAVFDPDVAGDAYGFAIALVQHGTGPGGTGVRHAVYLHRAEATLPVPGDYPLAAFSAAAPFRAGVVLDGDGDDPLLCEPESGSVRIATASATAIRGDFAFGAECRHADGTAAGAVHARGSFSAAAGTITVPETPPPVSAVGRFALVSVNGASLPAASFDGIVLGEDDDFFHLLVTATEGYLEIRADGSYEHRVLQDVRVDEQAQPPAHWVDHGRCTITGPSLSCVSGLLQNVTFAATVDGAAIELAQDLVGERHPATYRYVRTDG